MSVGVGTITGNGTGNGTGRNLAEEVDLELNQEENNKHNGSSAQQTGAKNSTEPKTEQKTESKKQKLSIEMNPADLKEIDVLVTLGIYESRDEFILEAVNEKKTEVMAKLKTAVKKR